MVKNKSIGLFVDGYAPIMDGVTLTVRNYAFWLNRIFGPTTVITPYIPNAVDDDPFPVYRFLSISTMVRRPYRIGLPEIDLSLQLFLKRHDFWLLHSHSPFGAGLAALKTARDKRIPIVSTLHSKYRDDLMRSIRLKTLVDDQIKRIVDYYYEVDHVWVPQASVGATLREYGYKGPYDVVENGIDLKPPEDITPFRERGAEHLGIPEGVPVGLYVGQHILEKNLEFLVRSLPSIIDALPGFRMVFVGQGYAKDQLRELASELGVADRTIFHDVVYDRELLKSIYARGDIFLFPSLYDNAPLVIREAAALRTPAVLVRGSTASEVIKDGENGFLATNDIDTFSGIVVRALSDQARLHEIGKRAQATLCRSWEDVVNEVSSRYAAILSRWSH